MHTLITDETANGQRLDHWLTSQLQPDYSRARLQTLIKNGALTLDGAQVLEAKQKLKAGQTIILKLPAAIDPEPKGENIPLDILYEDDDLIVINKPAGLVVHPGNGNETGTLVNALIHHCGNTLSGIGGVKRPGIVHRLDKDTSGVMVVAKNDRAHNGLSEQFADHGRTGVLKRCYLALVWGMPERANGTVNAPLGRSVHERTRQAVVPESRSDARHAVTHYTLKEKFGARDNATALASLIECQLETGRTHQIRVHMAHIGHPLIGDYDYGRAFKTKANKLPDTLKQIVQDFPRQALHAATLSFRHPINDEILSFSCPPPQDMQTLIAAFRLFQ